MDLPGRPKLTHVQLISACIDTGHRFRCTVAGFRPGKTSRQYVNKAGQTKDVWVTGVVGDGKGYPDLTFFQEAPLGADRGRIITMECKVGKDVLSPEQKMWRDVIRATKIAEWYLVTEKMWWEDDIEKIFAGTYTGGRV